MSFLAAIREFVAETARLRREMRKRYPDATEEG